MQALSVQPFTTVEFTKDDLRPTAVVPSGVSLVERVESSGSPVVELRSADGALVVEYLPEKGSCRIHAHAVHLRADADLNLSAGQRVKIEGAHGVELRSGSSSVAVEPKRLGLVAERVDTEARRLVQRVGELETEARQIFVRARESFREIEDLAQTKAGRLRLVATDTLRVLGRQAVIKAREDLKLRAGKTIYLE